MVGPAEKGIWADLLNAMMCSERYGYLTVRGKPMRDEEAAKICGTSVETYKPLLARLEEVGIPSRADDGTLYSRRLVRDYEAYKVASESGRRGGGNPLLRKKPEARSQKPEATVPLADTYKGTYKGNEKPENTLPCPGHVQDNTGLSASAFASSSESDSSEGESEGGAEVERQKGADKQAYGELGKVKLTLDEYGKLVGREGQSRADAGIEILDGYIGQKKKDPYANHYAVLKRTSWVWQRIDEKKRTEGGPRLGYVIE
jgi:hypothetical protein